MINTSLPTIAIDIDDVLAGTSDAIRRSINVRFNIDLQPKDYTIKAKYWDYYEEVWKAHGLTDPEILKDFYADVIAENVDITILPSANFAIEELSKKFNIIFITSRDKSWEAVTRKWFVNNFNNTDISLYFANNHKDSKAKTKGELCVELGAFLLIDDNTDHCRSALDKGIEAILFGQYGWHITIPEGAKQCKDWPAVLEYINGR